METIKEPSTHEFLAEELLIPCVNRTDSGRVAMFCQHLVQSVVLTNPERPKIFTRFENQVGDVSSGFIQAKENFVVKRILPRSNSFYSIIGEYADGRLDIFNFKKATNLSENYGYCNNFPDIDFWEEGQEIEKDAVLSAANCYDDFNNLMIGTNLKTIIYSHYGMTFEDSVVISETAAKKLSHTTVSEFFVPVNSNDVLVNLYGDENEYKAFPDIGEEIRNGMLCARRRIVNTTMLSSLNNAALRRRSSTDTTIYAKGVISDIYVYSNRDTNEFIDPSVSQLKSYLDRQKEYDTSLESVLAEAQAEGKLTDDAAYYYTRSKDSLDENIDWKSENAFDNVIIKFTITYEKRCTKGSKITNRSGNKGVVGLILPDDQMPETADGRRADVCMNPLGIINRLSWSTLYELELTAIAEDIRSKNCNKTYEEKLEVVYDFYKALNYSQYESISDFYEACSEEEQHSFVDSFFEEGMPMYMPPFFNNITFDELIELYDRFNVGLTKFKGIENPLVYGEIYFIKLKHEPSSKMSARSCGQINMKGVPNKTNRMFRAGMAPYSSPPIRFGEQELLNILLCLDNDAVFDTLDFHSSNKEDRKTLIQHLLTKSEDVPVEVTKSSTNTVKDLLKAHFTVLGLELRPSDENAPENVVSPPAKAE
jgi:DNA-directed RNA polymerase beta subunit